MTNRRVAITLTFETVHSSSVVLTTVVNAIARFASGYVIQSVNASSFELDDDECSTDEPVCKYEQEADKKPTPPMPGYTSARVGRA